MPCTLFLDDVLPASFTTYTAKNPEAPRLYPSRHRNFKGSLAYSTRHFSFYYSTYVAWPFSLFTFHPTKTNAEMLYALVLPGALATLIFPEWTTTPIFSYMYNHSFRLFSKRLSLLHPRRMRLRLFTIFIT